MNLLVIILLLAFGWVIIKLTWNGEEGTYEQRERNPELNTKNYELHEKRLKHYSKSKYKNRLFYIAVDGNCYYYSATGKKIFCT